MKFKIKFQNKKIYCIAMKMGKKLLMRIMINYLNIYIQETKDICASVAVVRSCGAAFVYVDSKYSNK